MRHSSTVHALLTVLILRFCCLSASATTYYVDVKNTTSTPPYTSWSTASTDIQSAINQSTSGDLVLVTNGVYLFNGENVYGVSNRVAITQPVTVESVNGPAVTYIQGGSTAPYFSQVRCVYMTNGAALIGFTVTNGGTIMGSDPIKGESGGGIWCESPNVVISNCVITTCQTYYEGGGVYSGTLFNCMLRTNINEGPAGSGGGGAANSVLVNCTISRNMSFFSGGGAYFCTLSNCNISDNLDFGQFGGGGVSQSILNNCVISNNATSGPGGGAYLSYLTNCLIIDNNASNAFGLGGGVCLGVAQNCTIVSNSASSGGGAYGGTTDNGSGTMILNNCTIAHNLAQNGGGAAGGGPNCTLNDCTLMFNAGSQDGGGAYSAELTNCLIISNSVSTGNPGSFGGGIYECLIENCTVAGNSSHQVGGAFSSVIDNSICYDNFAQLGATNYSGGTFNFSCTTPLPSNGIRNITNDPAFVNLAGGDFHLQSSSPCINSGNNIYITSATDLDGNPRIVGGTVDSGAYEYQTPTSVISYAYLQKYNLRTDGSVDFLDLDSTGFTVYQDWIAGLNPINPASALVMMPVTTTNTTAGITVSWQSVSGVSYFLQRTTSLPAPFTTIQSNIIGQPSTTSYSDTSATNGTPYFYRVGVQAP